MNSRRHDCGSADPRDPIVLILLVGGLGAIGIGWRLLHAVESGLRAALHFADQLSRAVVGRELPTVFFVVLLLMALLGAAVALAPLVRHVAPAIQRLRVLATAAITTRTN
jgi:hypothetical protein